MIFIKVVRESLMNYHYFFLIINGKIIQNGPVFFSLQKLQNLGPFSYLPKIVYYEKEKKVTNEMG